jgi:hypothetical protein
MAGNTVKVINASNLAERRLLLNSSLPEKKRGECDEPHVFASSARLGLPLSHLPIRSSQFSRRCSAFFLG